MSLSEKKIIDLIEILDGGYIQVREAYVIEKDGVVIAKNFHRYVLNPGDDLSNQDKKLKDIASIIWTAEIIEAYQKTLINTI